MCGAEVDERDAAIRAAAISQTYRGGGGSKAIRTEADALAYALARMPATYAAVAASLTSLASTLIDIRVAVYADRLHTVEPQQDALELTWFSPAELMDPGVLAEMSGGQGTPAARPRRLPPSRRPTPCSSAVGGTPSTTTTWRSRPDELE